MQKNYQLLTIEELQNGNCGTADDYISNKELNEEIHRNIENKKTKRSFTMKDWEKKSEKYIEKHTWDIATGKFISNTELARQLNKMGK